MKSHVLRAFGKTPQKKTLKFHPEFNLSNFQEKKYGKV